MKINCMKTSIKENVKRNITIGGIALIFITLIIWIKTDIE